MTDTLTFPAPAFARLIEHKRATTIEVMDPQPDIEGQGFKPPGEEWYYNIADYVDKFAPHRQGDTVWVEQLGECLICHGRKKMFKRPERGSLRLIVDPEEPIREPSPAYETICDCQREATVVSVTAKLVRDVTAAEWIASGRCKTWWIKQHPDCPYDNTRPFDTTYAWVTEWELKE